MGEASDPVVPVSAERGGARRSVPTCPSTAGPRADAGERLASRSLVAAPRCARPAVWHLAEVPRGCEWRRDVTCVRLPGSRVTRPPQSSAPRSRLVPGAAPGPGATDPPFFPFLKSRGGRGLTLAPRKSLRLHLLDFFPRVIFKTSS